MDNGKSLGMIKQKGSYNLIYTLEGCTIDADMYKDRLEGKKSGTKKNNMSESTLI